MERPQPFRKKKRISDKCNSLNIVKNGSRKTAIENKQRFKCKDCEKRFVLDPVKRIKDNGKIVTWQWICISKDYH